MHCYPRLSHSNLDFSAFASADKLTDGIVSALERYELTLLAVSETASLRIVKSIIDGRRPVRLDRSMLIEAELPLCWQEQERMLGLAN